MSIRRSVFVVIMTMGISGFFSEPAQAQNAPPTISSLKALCGQTGGNQACWDLGKAYALGEGVTIDKVQSAKYLLTACEYNDPNACVRSGDIAKDAKAYDLMIDAYGLGCTLKSPAACEAGYFETKNDEGPIFRPKAAANFLMTACRSGEAYFCNLMGDWFNPKFDPKPGRMPDVKMATAGYDRACDGQVNQFFTKKRRSRACFMSYYYAAGNYETYSNPNQADYALEQACLMGDDQSCHRGAFGFLDGSEGVTKSLDKAIQVAAIGCDRDHLGSCQKLESIHREVTLDQTKLLSVQDKLCLSGMEKGYCQSVVYDYYLAGDILPNNKSMRTYLTPACESGYGFACYAIALEEESQDAALAKTMAKKACNLGYTSGCNFQTWWDRFEAREAYMKEFRRKRDEANREWQQAMKDQSAQANAANRERLRKLYNEKLNMGSTARIPTTPFGSTQRDIENWNKYQANQCAGNPRC